MSPMTVVATHEKAASPTPTKLLVRRNKTYCYFKTEYKVKAYNTNEIIAQRKCKITDK